MSISTESTLVRQHARPTWTAGTLSLLLLGLPVVAQAQFTYTIANGSVTITGYTGPGGAVTIPSTMAGLPVTGIGYEAFAGNSTLTSVTIPSSVINIGAEAFIVSPNLTAINVAANNPAYSSEAGVLFDKQKTALIEYPPGKAGSYTVPMGVIGIGGYAFYCCYVVTDVALPNSVRNIGEWAFAECYCHRADQNRPPVGTSKPASLR